MLLSLPSSVEVPSPISNGERRGRQDRLVEGFGSDHLIILSNPPLQTRSNDVHHPYRSHSDLLYFVGWRQPGAVFVMSHESGSWVRHLFVPARDVEREISGMDVGQVLRVPSKPSRSMSPMTSRIWSRCCQHSCPTPELP